MKLLNSQRCSPHRIALVLVMTLGALSLVSLHDTKAVARQQQILWTDQEKPIADKLRTLRKIFHDERAQTTKALALQIRQLPVGINQLRLANGLANLATEGDFGRDMLQDVTITLATSSGDAAWHSR